MHDAYREFGDTLSQYRATEPTKEQDELAIIKIDLASAFDTIKWHFRTCLNRGDFKQPMRVKIKRRWGKSVTYTDDATIITRLDKNVIKRKMINETKTEVQKVQKITAELGLKDTTKKKVRYLGHKIRPLVTQNTKKNSRGSQKHKMTNNQISKITECHNPRENNSRKQTNNFTTQVHATWNTYTTDQQQK